MVHGCLGRHLPVLDADHPCLLMVELVHQALQGSTILRSEGEVDLHDGHPAASLLVISFPTALVRPLAAYTLLKGSVSLKWVIFCSGLDHIHPSAWKVISPK